jgi:hypothetical protein
VAFPHGPKVLPNPYEPIGSNSFDPFGSALNEGKESRTYPSRTEVQASTFPLPVFLRPLPVYGLPYGYTVLRWALPLFIPFRGPTAPLRPF